MKTEAAENLFESCMNTMWTLFCMLNDRTLKGEKVDTELKMVEAAIKY